MNVRFTALALVAVVAQNIAGAQHRVALQGNGTLTLLDADGNPEWQMPWGATPDVHVAHNGNLMVLRGRSEIVEIEPSTKRVVWTYSASASGVGMQIHSFEPLPSGNLLVAESGPGRLIEVDRRGEIHREVPAAAGFPAAQLELRAVKVLEGGNLLVAQDSYTIGAAAVREYDGASGELAWEYKLPAHVLQFDMAAWSSDEPVILLRQCLDALRLPNGNTLIATGGERALIEVTRGGKIAWSLGKTDLGGLSLDGGTGVQLLANGNYALGNFGAAAGEPFLVEIEPKSKKIVWSLDRFGEAGSSVSHAAIVDDGPGAALLARARKIHREALTLDTHKDIATSLASPEIPKEPVEAARAIAKNDPTVWGSNQVDFPKMRSGGLDVAFYIVYVGQSSLDEKGFARARTQAIAKFDAIERMAARYPNDIEIARSADDVERIASAGKLVACIGIENGYAMGTDLAAIEEFHRRGARYMSLTHNRHSQLGDSNTPPNAPLHGGLSDLGRKAIEEMNRVGIMVDVSHAGEVTTLQAIAHSKAPVIASHSGVDGVYKHGRNLSDAELLALKANGGVIQCVAFASYVKDMSDRNEFIVKARADVGLPAQQGNRAVDSDPDTLAKMKALRERMRAYDAAYDKSSVKHFADHIDYAVKLIGIDHVAISSDFDGGGGVLGWNDASETFNVTLELVRRGYSDEDIKKIWSGNTLRVWRAVEKVAESL